MSCAVPVNLRNWLCEQGPANSYANCTVSLDGLWTAAGNAPQWVTLSLNSTRHISAVEATVGDR